MTCANIAIVWLFLLDISELPELTKGLAFKNI